MTREEFLQSKEWGALKEAAGGELSANFLKAGEKLAAYLERKGKVMVVIFRSDSLKHHARFAPPNIRTDMYDVVFRGEQWTEEIGIKLQALIRFHDGSRVIRTVLHSTDPTIFDLVDE